MERYWRSAVTLRKLVGLFLIIVCLLLLSASPFIAPSAEAAAVDSIKITSPANGAVITGTKLNISVSYSYAKWNDYYAGVSYIQMYVGQSQVQALGVKGNVATAQSGTFLYEVDMVAAKAQPGKYPLIAALYQGTGGGSSGMLQMTEATIITYQPPGVPATPTPTPTPKPTATLTTTPKPTTTPTLAPAAMYIYSDPGGAQIYIDGVYRTDTNFGASGVGFTDLTPNKKYHVVIKKDGYVDFVSDVTLNPNEIRDVRAKLVVGVTPTGEIRINCDPEGAMIYLAGVKLTTAPTTLTDVKPGSYQITIKKDGYDDWYDTVTVTAGKTTTINAELPLIDGGMSPVIPIAGGVVGVGAAAAIAKGLASRKPSLPVPPKTVPTPAAPPTPTGEPLLGTEMNGKVYYIHPGDEGGAYWMPKSTYLEVRNMMSQGMVWDKSAHGWMTPQDQAEWKRSTEAFREANIRGDIERNAKIKREMDALKAAQKAKADYEAAKSEYIDYLKERQTFLEKQQDANEYSFLNATKTGAQNISREVFTCRTDDGSFSYKSLAVRLGADFLTLGWAEAGYAPIETGYMTKDGMAEGKNFAHALNDAIATEAIMQGIGHGAGKIVSAGGAKLAQTGFGKAVVGEGKALMEPVVNAYERANASFQKAMAGLSKTAEPVLTASEQAAKDAIKNAIENNDRDAIKALYENGGRKTLGELEKKGALSAQEAAHLNNVMKTEVNQAIDESTKTAIDNLQKQTGVKVKEVLVGDSGSSARGGNVRSINTDYDKTYLVEYDPASLKQYADTHFGGDVNAAKDALNQQAFPKTLNDAVTKNLKNSKLTPDDVDFKAYHGFGETSGHADSYPTNYTQARQATQGTTTVYQPKADGTIRSYKAGAETITDQHALNQAAKGDFTQLNNGGPKIPEKEIPGLAKQQLDAMPKAVNDAKTASKALGRMQKARELAGLPGVDPKLMKVANGIQSAPQDALKALGTDGQKQFIELTKKEIENSYSDILKWFATK